MAQIIGQGVIPDDWTGEYCRYAICWPASEQWLAVLRGVLTLPARGRFWDEHTGTITEAQEVIRETFDNNLHLREVIMACGDEGLNEIAQALLSISLSMQRQGCCDNIGSGGQGSTAPPFDPVEQGDPIMDPPPEGFDTWEDFLNQKCAIAWNIVEQLENDMGNMVIIQITGSTLSGLGALIAITIITPIPFDDIIAIAAFLLSIGSTIVISTALDIINNNEEVLVCALYNGTNAQSSHDMFLSEFNALVDSGVSDPIENFAVKQFVAYMIGSPVTNRLYTKDLTKVWPSRICTDCPECEPVIWDFEDETVQGWSAVSSLPGCFGLTQPPLGSINAAGGLLTCVGVTQGTFKVVAIDHSVDNWALQAGWILNVGLQCSGSVGLYIDVVFETDEGSCVWHTLSNSHVCDGFTGLSVGDDDLVGEHLSHVYIYMRSSTGASALTVDFEGIDLLCEP